MASYGKPVSVQVGAVPKKKTLHLMQCSLQRSDSDAELTHDINYAMGEGPDVIGFTELVSAHQKDLFKRVCRDGGYKPVVPTAAGLTVPLAVKEGGDGDLKFKSMGAKLALKGVAGQYENRYISWVQIRWWGQNIYVHEGHWSRTKWGVNRHSDVSTMMAGQVKKHGQGNGISFWMGDLNITQDEYRTDGHLAASNNLNQIFRQNGLLSLFDELKSNPPDTLSKGTYDFIGCYRPDKQVEGKRYKVHPKQRSDHSFVSGFYEIDVSTKVSTQLVKGNIGNDGPKTKEEVEEVDPDFYATGGSINYDDFLNDDLYPLPYAYGDSDSRTYG